MKVRLDQLLADRGLAPSRAKAQALVLAGNVYVAGKKVDKAGTLVKTDAEVEVRGEAHGYVSRGGVKLAGALDALGVDPKDKVCIDLGASTGGFTDCLLQRGAARVAAVDVGYGQLAHKLRVDPRVLVRERTNARTLTPEDVGGPADLVVVDASFIGLGKLLPAVVACLASGGELVALVKPQFEAGREEAARGRGVIRDPEVRERAITGVIEELDAHGLELLGRCDAPIAGPKGNLEAFVHARKRAPRE
jgi:23S rRNA (cytidine1920-2'-O)/16S rRNA (cytidine1409-2'-O)-methyltransferase